MDEGIFNLAVAPGGQKLAASGFGKAWLFDLAAGDTRSPRLFKSSAAFKPGFSADGSLFVLGGDSFSLFRVSDDALLVSLAPPPEVESDYSWPGFWLTPDSQNLVTGRNGVVTVATLVGQPKKQLPSATNSPAVGFSSDAGLMATSGGELWRVGLWTQVWASPPPEPRLGSAPFRFLHDDGVAFSPDDSEVLISNANRENIHEAVARTRLLRVSDGALLRDFGDMLGPKGNFSPDGAFITAGRRVVHRASGAVTTLAEDVTSSVFVDNDRIAAAGPDPVVRFFCAVK